MAAEIRTTVGGFVVTGASRDYSNPGPPQVDLIVGDVVTVESVGAGATTFAWSLAYIPEGSSAVFSTTGTPTAITASPGTFTIDQEGPYLLRLMTDAGLATEDEQFVRIRCLTAFGDLKLVAAGERVDNPSIPVDLTSAGWAEDQNFNLLTLLGFAETVASSGRVLYVDSVSGDYNTIQAAMDYANTQSPTNASPWLVLVRPGVYTEDLTFYSAVHVYGWPGNKPAFADDGIGERVVVVRNNTTTEHRAWLTGSGDVTISNLFFEQTAATANPVISTSSTASDRVFINRCSVIANGTDASQGPAIQAMGGVSLGVSDCRLEMNSGAGAGQPALLTQANAQVSIERTILAGRSGVRHDAATACVLRDCTIQVDGTYGVQTIGVSLSLEYCHILGGPTTAIEANPTGGAVPGALGVEARWSRIGGTITFDPTGVVGSTSLGLGSSEHGAVTVVAPLTSQVAITPSDTLFYDNTTTGITAADVQAALDEIYTYASQVRTLDDAYDGGTPGPTGTGRTIYADAGAVQIMDADPPVGPVDNPGNTDGRLQVSSSVEIGSVGSPEINLDPNPYGIGPEITLGEEVWAGGAPFGSTSFVRSNSTGAPMDQNYNLGLSAVPASGGGTVGSVVVRGGVGLDSGKGTDPAAGDVHVLGGEASGPLTAAANGGSVYIGPGDSVAPGSSPGSIFLGRAQDATPATLEGAGAASDPIGIDGEVTIGTDMGAFTVTFAAADNLATVVGKLSTPGYVDSAEVAGVITLTSITKGPAAEVYWISSTDAGLDAALGNLSGGTKVTGTWPSQMEVVVSAANEISFGPSGTTGPLVYNADTGKLTVPGIIDPTGMIYTESTLTNLTLAANGWTGSGVGGLYVSDGTDGQDNNHLYYVFETGTPIKLSGGGTGTVVGPGSSTDNALARFDGVTGQVIQNSDAILTDGPNGELILAGDLAVSPNSAGFDASARLDRLDATSDAAILYQTGATTQWVAGVRSGSTDYTLSSNGGINERLKIDGSGNVTVNNAYTLPSTDGAAVGEVLTTDAAGNVTWSAAGGGTMSSFTITDNSSNTSTITNGDTLTFANTAGETTVAVSGDNVSIGLPNTGVTAATYISPVIAVDSTGRITSATTNPGLQGAYDYGNTLVTAGPTDISFTLSAAGGGFIVNGDGNVLIGLTAPINTFSVSSIATATLTSQDEVDIIVGANDATDKVLDLTATNAGAGGAFIRLTADDETIVVRNGGVDTEILTLTQTTGESFGIFAGTASPSGSVSADAGSLFIRDTGAGAELYQNTSTGSGTTWSQVGAGGGGDVTGPAGATDEALARFDGATGKIIQNSNATLTNGGDLTLAGDITITKAAVANSFVLIDRLNNTVSSAVIHTTGAVPDWTTGTTSTSSDYTIADGGGNERLRVDGSGNVTFNTAFTLPNADGGANQVLQTDGAGTVSWAAAGGGGGTTSLNFTHTSGTLKIADITANDIVLSVWVRFTTAFDDGAATVAVIENGLASAVVSAASLDPTDIAGSFYFNPVFINTTGASEIQIQVNPAAATTGAGTVIVMIHEV